MSEPAQFKRGACSSYEMVNYQMLDTALQDQRNNQISVKCFFWARSGCRISYSVANQKIPMIGISSSLNGLVQNLDSKQESNLISPSHFLKYLGNSRFENPGRQGKKTQRPHFNNVLHLKMTIWQKDLLKRTSGVLKM